MIALRRICILLVGIGCSILLLRHESSFDTVPFPGKGLRVKLAASVHSEGEFCLQAAMPVTNSAAPLGGERIPCLLTVTVSSSGNQVLQTEVKAFEWGSEFGWAGIQYFDGPAWHLKRGEYDIQVESHGDCAEVITRGAALSVGQVQSHVTERFLTASFLHFIGVAFLGAGLAGLVFCEIKKV
jgi:hypothetical protein